MSHHQIYKTPSQTDKNPQFCYRTPTGSKSRIKSPNRSKDSSKGIRAQIQRKNNRKKFAKIFPQAKFEEEDEDALKLTITSGIRYEDRSYDYRFENLTFPKNFDQNSKLTWKRISEIYRNPEFTLFDQGVRDFKHYSGMFNRLKNEKIYFSSEDNSTWIRSQFRLLNACNLLIGAHGIQILDRIFDEDNSFFKEIGAYKVNLNIGGIWTEYIIDDFVPVRQGEKIQEEFLYSGILKDSHEGLYEVWLIVLEKVFSKAYNGYKNLSRIPVFEFLKSLTGAPFELYRIGDEETEFQGFDSLDLGRDQTKIWTVLKEALNQNFLANFCVNSNNSKKLRRLETFNTTRQEIHLDEGVFYAVESIQELPRGQKYVILDTTYPTKLKIPFEEFIKIIDYLNILKLRPSYAFNSTHIPLSSAHYLQSVIKIGIQEAGTYTFQICQKSPFFYPKSSKFEFNDLTLTLAYLRENSIEYIGHKSNKGKSKLSFEVKNSEDQEVQIIALIDFECNEQNRRRERHWKGDLKHWRDLVFSVYGSEFCTLNSLALDRNRGMVYDFFLHRIWREFSRGDYMKFEGKEIAVKAWEMVASLDNGGKETVQFMRQGCQLDHLTFFKFTNFSQVQIRLEEILETALPNGLECFGPFEVNNLNPSLVINPNSSDILLFKFNDRISSVEGVSLKNSSFKVKMTNLDNPEDFYGQDPYEHIIKEYKVQSSRTYPTATFVIPVHANLSNNQNFEKVRQNFRLIQPKLSQQDIQADSLQYSSIYKQQKAPGEEVGSAALKIDDRNLRSRSNSKSRIKPYNTPKNYNTPGGYNSIKNMRFTGRKYSNDNLKPNYPHTFQNAPSFQVESIKISGIDDIKNMHSIQEPQDQFGNIGVSFGDCNESNEVFGRNRVCYVSNRNGSREKRVIFDSLDSHTRGKIFEMKEDMQRRRETIAFQDVKKENQILSFGEDLGLDNLPQEIRTKPPTPKVKKSSSRRITISSQQASRKNLSKKGKSSGHNTFVNLQSFPSSRSRLDSVSHDEHSSKNQVSISDIKKKFPVEHSFGNESRKDMMEKKTIIQEIKEIGKHKVGEERIVDMKRTPIISTLKEEGSRKSIVSQRSYRSVSQQRSNPSLTPQKSYQSIDHYNSGKKSPVLNRSLQKSVEVKRSPQRNTEVKRSPQRNTEVKRSPQRNTEVKRSPQRNTEVKRSPQRSIEVKRSPQRSIEVKRSPQRNIEVKRSPQRNIEVKRSYRSIGKKYESHKSISREGERISVAKKSNRSIKSVERAKSRKSISSPQSQIKAMKKKSEKSLSSHRSHSSIGNKSYRSIGQQRSKSSKSMVSRHTSAKKITIRDDSKKSVRRSFNDNNGSRRSYSSVTKPLEKSPSPSPKKIKKEKIFNVKDSETSPEKIGGVNKPKKKRRETANFNSRGQIRIQGSPNKSKIILQAHIPKQLPKPKNERRHTFGLACPKQKSPQKNLNSAMNPIPRRNTVNSGQNSKPGNYRKSIQIQNPFNNVKRRTSRVSRRPVKNSKISTKKVITSPENPFKNNTRSSNSRINNIKREMLKNNCRALTPVITSNLSPKNSKYRSKSPILKQPQNINRIVRLSDKKREKVIIKAETGINNNSNNQEKLEPGQVKTRPIFLQNRFKKGIQPPKNKVVSNPFAQATEKENSGGHRISRRTRKIRLNNPLGLSFAQQGKISVRTNYNRNSVNNMNKTPSYRKRVSGSKVGVSQARKI